MKINSRILIRSIACIIFIGCVMYLGIYFINGYRSQKELELLAKRVNNVSSTYQKEPTSIDATVVNTDNDNVSINEEQKDKAVTTSIDLTTEVITEPIILPQFLELYEENPDLIGWIKIDGTKVDYPVMQTKQDGEFYLRRNFKKEKDQSGLPFLDYRSDIQIPSTNFIIYGHNMDNGTMFRDLLRYKRKEYYEEHPVIKFDTIYQQGEYEIVAVFLSKIYKVGDDVFKYYQFIQADTKEEFDSFISNIKEIALYDTGVNVEYGEQLITLSTCEYSTENGRLAIVAKKISNED